MNWTKPVSNYIIMKLFNQVEEYNEIFIWISEISIPEQMKMKENCSQKIELTISS